MLTCLLSFHKGSYKGTYTLPKQHKRRSGIRSTVAPVSYSCLLNDMSHRTAPSCGDTMQQSPTITTIAASATTTTHQRARCSPSVRPSVHHRAACNQEECLSPQHKLCVCVRACVDHPERVCVLHASPSLPLNEESFRTGEIRGLALPRAEKQSKGIGEPLLSLFQKYSLHNLPRWHQSAALASGLVLKSAALSVTLVQSAPFPSSRPLQI